MKQSFKVIVIHDINDRPLHYLRLEAEGQPPVNINIGITTAEKIKPLTNGTQKTKEVGNDNK